MIITSPKNKEKNVPEIKKGAKGTSDFKLFLFKKTKDKPIIAPRKKEKNKATKIFGQPKKRLIKKNNSTSPKPNHFPLEIR